MKKRDFLAVLGRWVTSYPWWTILLALLITANLSFGLAQLAFKNDYRVYFGKDNPQMLAFEAIQNTFNKSDNSGF